MATKRKKKDSELGGGEAPPNPEAVERKRLKTLAFSGKILSQNPARPSAPLAPSKAVARHHGRDIVKKSHRKNRFLLSFPGLLAPISGGKIGELKDLGTKNPILYLDFPQVVPSFLLCLDRLENENILVQILIFVFLGGIFRVE